MRIVCYNVEGSIHHQLYILGANLPDFIHLIEKDHTVASLNVLRPCWLWDTGVRDDK